MKFKMLHKAAGLLLAGALLFTSIPALTMPQTAMAAEGISGTADKWKDKDPSKITLRDYATPSVSFVGWGAGSDNFADDDMKSFWNGHSDPNIATSPQWMMYDFGEFQVNLSGMKIAFYDDGSGVFAPADITTEYKDASGNWTEITRKGTWTVTGGRTANPVTYEFEEITTTAIRVTMVHGNGPVAVFDWDLIGKLALTDEEAVTVAAQSLAFPEVREGRISSRLYEKVTLPAKAVGNLVDVSWKSKTPDVISDAGEITPPAANTKVTLEATCTRTGKPEVKAVADVEFLVLSKDTTEFAMTIDQKNRGVDISQKLYGVFYEDINSSADGGLSAELIKNNSFENYQNIHATTSPEVKGDQTSWKLHWNSSNAANFTVERTDGLNANNKNYAKITGNQTLSNHGFVGRATLDKSAIAIRKGVKYDFSMYMKAAAGYAGTVKAKVVDDTGAALTNEAALTLQKDGTWKKVSASLTGTDTKLGTLVLTFEGAADTDVMYIDMVSLAPTDTFGYGNKNYSYGAGLRKDLVEKLQQLKPGFIRFPGGCVVEGSYGTDGYYNWEDSVGPLEERRAIGSYWGSPGKSVNYYQGESSYGYMMSYQFGYHEILTLCEDLGAEALPILSAGIFCQFTDAAKASVKGEALKPFADHATHLIDYCWGDPNSLDAVQAEWAKKRVANGHEEPFDLKYVGIGNENWNDANQGVSYRDNFIWIKNYVENYVKEHYTDRKITIISSTGPYYQGHQNTEAWKWINADVPGETLVDEHYYINYDKDDNNTLLSGDYIYDSYKRLKDGGSEVFVGEYAGHNNATTENVLDTAISEAAYMTGLERNADIVRHASYAPLFEREGCRDWHYNLIKFNAFESYGTPSYYVQTMYSNNYGDHIINTVLEKYDGKNGVATAYDKKPGHQTDLYYVTSEDDKYIYTKLVSHADYPKEITLNYPGIADGAKVEVISLSGDAMDRNTIENQTKVAPVTKNQTLAGESMTCVIPAMSLTVVKVQTGEDEVVDRTALEASIAAAEGKKQADYTAGSWSKMQEALNAAKAAVSKEDATQAEINDAKAALDTAVGALVKKAVPPTVTNKTKTLVVGETFSVKKKGYTYKSSDKKTASVSKTGTVKALKGGKTVTITATSGDKKKVIQYKVTIKKAPDKISKVTYKLKGAKKAKNITLKNGKGTISLKKGKSVTLTPSVAKGRATKYKFAFTASKAKKYATLSSKGLLKAKKKGTVKVKIQTLNNKSVTITVKIK